MEDSPVDKLYETLLDQFNQITEKYGDCSFLRKREILYPEDRKKLSSLEDELNKLLKSSSLKCTEHQKKKLKNLRESMANYPQSFKTS